MYVTTLHASNKKLQILDRGNLKQFKLDAVEICYALYTVHITE